MLYFLSVLLLIWAISRKTYTIRVDDEKYMTRVYLAPWLRKYFDINVFLHYFHKSDKREYHSHPWLSSWSLILWGGYKENRTWKGSPVGCHRTIKPLSINRIGANDFHYVELLNEKRGCLTLFFAGNNPDREWGFLRDDGSYESANDRFDSKEEALSGD